MVPKTALFSILFRLTVSMRTASLFVPEPCPSPLRIEASFRLLKESSVGGIVESTRYAVGRIPGTYTDGGLFAAPERSGDIAVAEVSAKEASMPRRVFSLAFSSSLQPWLAFTDPVTARE
jgi:hypothetical protein